MAASIVVDYMVMNRARNRNRTPQKSAPSQEGDLLHVEGR